MKYLVLGSSGQIGSVLVSYLVQKNHDVFEFDILRSAEEDLRIPNNALLKEHLLNVDFVFFLAYDIGDSRYLNANQHKFDFLANNTLIMINTFRLLYETGKPFIFTSSQMSSMQFSSYGALKTLGEKYTIALNGVYVKLWNVYGVENDISKAHVITHFIFKAKTNGYIDMLTDGKEERQFVYAEDCAECLFNLSNIYSKIDRSKELNIASFEWTSINSVAQIIKKIFPTISVIPNVLKDTTQNSIRIEPDPFILQYWQPKTSLEQGIKQVVAKIS